MRAQEKKTAAEKELAGLPEPPAALSTEVNTVF
jgi:hypothetical protein